MINEKLRDILAVPEYFGGPQALSFEHSRAVGPLDSVTNANKKPSNKSIARTFDLSLKAEDLKYDTGV